jgi:hypothetical protein
MSTPSHTWAEAPVEDRIRAIACVTAELAEDIRRYPGDLHAHRQLKALAMELTAISEEVEK